jgi:hypothetical protein
MLGEGELRRQAIAASLASHGEKGWERASLRCVGFFGRNLIPHRDQLDFFADWPDVCGRPFEGVEQQYGKPFSQGCP